MSEERVVTTEQTRLLNKITTSYTTTQQESSTSQTVITMENSHQRQGSTSKLTSRHHYQDIITSGQPIVPTHQLTEKIQDILIFNDIKKSRAAAKSKDEGIAVVPSNSSNSSSSDDDSESKLNLKKKMSEWSLDGKLKKRDLAADAFKFATDKWKQKHGYSQQVTDKVDVVTTLKDDDDTVIVKQKVKVDNAQSIFDVAKNASVCAVLGLLHEHKQSSEHSIERDMSLQTLALSTLNLGLKAHDTSVSHVVLYEMLTTKWLNGKSALELAIENNSQLLLSDSRVQSVIEDLWKSGPNWRQDPNHPSYIWLSQSSISLDNTKVKEERQNFILFVMTRTFIDFLAKWPSVRYQAIVGLFTFLVYLAFHLATVTNMEYTSDTLFVYEYAYYAFVVSDVFLEFYKFWMQPFRYLKKVSFYVTALTLALLASSFVIRIFTLIFVYSLEYEVYLLTISYGLVILATPLMFARLFITSTDLFWSTAKVSYILHQCFVNSIWVFNLGLFVVLGFWITLGALQFHDIRPLTMLRLLILGALHAPEIGHTLYYQPTIAGLLLVIYLFFTIVILGALLTASFLSTLLDLNKRMDTIKRDWVIERCLKSNPIINAFIPSVVVDMIFGIVRWISRVVFKKQQRLIWLEKTHQVFWYIIYSPVIVLVGLYQLLTSVIFRWQMVKKLFKKDTVVVN